VPVLRYFFKEILFRRFHSSGILLYIVVEIVSDDSNDRSAFIFRVKQSKEKFFLFCLTLNLNLLRLFTQRYKLLL